MKKISTLLLFVCICAAQSFAQWNENWSDYYQHTTAAGKSNEARFTVSDVNGNVYTLSDCTSDLDSIDHPTAQTHYYVVLRKYDYAGTLLIHKQIELANMPVSGFEYRSAFGLTIDASGFIYIAYTSSASGNYNVSAIKYNNSLVAQWSKTYTATGDQYGIDMVVNSGATFCAYRSVSGGNTSYALVKLDGTAGIVAPIHTFDANLDVVTAISMTGSKSIYVTGSRLVAGAKTVMTASVNTSGGTKWKVMFNNNSATGDDYGNDIAMGSDGNIYVSGTVYVNGTNGKDAIVLRYLVSTGAVQGYVNINLGSTSDEGAKIAAGQSGFLYAASASNTKAAVSKITLSPFAVSQTAIYLPTPLTPYTSLTKVTVGDMKIAASTYNVYLTGEVQAVAASGNFSASYLAKYGQNGFTYRVLSSQSVEGEYADCYAGVGVALDPTHNNNILWLRSQWSNNTSHNTETSIITGLASGGTLRQGSPASGASAMGEVAGDISFYPNPAKGTIYFNTNKSITKIEVVDAIGNLITTLVPSSGNSLDISMLKAGVYFAKVMAEDGVVIKRIVVR